MTTHRYSWTKLILAVALASMNMTTVGQTVKVVNMVPSTNSGETNQDSEPGLAVNPANPLQLAGTAFTPDPMGTAGIAPVYFSSDGGSNWTLNSILTVPADNNCVGNSTCDITTRFGETSGNLYLSWLTADSAFNIPFLVARSQPFPGPPAAPTNLQTINTSYPNVIDQPFTQAWTALSGPNSGDDRVYVGENDLRGGTGGHTGGFDASQTAENAPPAGFSTLQELEVRPTCSQDGPPIRPAVHPTGVIYGAFYSWSAGCGGGAITTDVVVVRDDNWGSGGSPYQALKDSDTLAGKRVVTGVSLPSCNSTVGNQRVCGSLSIAVDPNDNQKVWIAWAQGTSGTNYTLHVRASADGGASWGSDLLTVSPAVNAALAITTQSKVGFLYQKLVSPGTCTGGSPCWETHLQTTTHGTSWTDMILANTPDTLTSSINNIIGDYEYLAAVGKNFYGVFSANNLPQLSNFPQGVTYQRFADLAGAHALYSDMAHTTTVSASVDPFFFSVTNVADSEDYYVRDWTDSMTSHDNGEEPSTSPVWWTTSDVWNRLTNTTGTFNGNDQPDHQVAQDATSGHNFAFVRVHRKAAAAMGAPTEQVSASFIFADYGLGVPYEYVTGSPLSSTAALSFAAADTVQVLADGAGIQWDLPAERSTHVCMAVEIAGPSDPYSPELVGRAPGWPTDLLLTTDNNKAQINMDLPPMAMGGLQFSSFGIAHNAALYARDMTIRYAIATPVLRKIAGSSILVVGDKSIPVRGSGTLQLKNMQPGESRWIGVSFRAPSARVGDSLAVRFEEMAGPNTLNAFTIAPRVADPSQVIRANLKSHRADFYRLAAAFHVEGASEESKAAGELLKQETVPGKEYLQFLIGHGARIRAMLSKLSQNSASTSFGAQQALAAMEAAAKAGNVASAANSHASLLNALDGAMTMIQKAEGDPADYLQMVQWQLSLYTGTPWIHATKDASRVVKESKAFIAEVDRKKANVKDYPELLKALLGSFHATSEGLETSSPGLEAAVGRLGKTLEEHNMRAIERAHREFLLELASIPAKRATQISAQAR